MLRDCSRRSLVMLDEIGKGTSARDGAALRSVSQSDRQQAPMSGSTNHPPGLHGRE